MLKSDRQLESRADAEERTDGNARLTQIPIRFHSKPRLATYQRRLCNIFAIYFRFSSKLDYQRKVRQPADDGEQENKQQTLYVLKFVIQRLKILTRLKKLFSSFSLFLVLFLRFGEG